MGKKNRFDCFYKNTITVIKILEFSRLTKRMTIKED